MNLYLRYFEDETLVSNVDEAISFLDSLDEVDVTEQMVKELHDYVKSDVMYPKRYKVRPRAYFIVIKTEARTMQDFKDKKAIRSVLKDQNRQKEQLRLSDEMYGWYEGTLNFKRVVVNHVGKCEYRDTVFTAQCKAISPIECYDRITSYLATRVDERSQFPSAKGKNFIYTFLGTCKEEGDEMEVFETEDATSMDIINDGEE